MYPLAIGVTTFRVQRTTKNVGIANRGKMSGSNSTKAAINGNTITDRCVVNHCSILPALELPTAPMTANPAWHPPAPEESYKNSQARHRKRQPGDDDRLDEVLDGHHDAHEESHVENERSKPGREQLLSSDRHRIDDGERFEFVAFVGIRRERENSSNGECSEHGECVECVGF